jgi:hypothetical protein
MLGDDVGCPLEYTAYHDVAAGYGGVGLVISSQDDDVVATLEKAQEHEVCYFATMTFLPPPSIHLLFRHHDVLNPQSNGSAVLINVHIGSTTFREGSISA